MAFYATPVEGALSEHSFGILTTTWLMLGHAEALVTKAKSSWPSVGMEV